MLEGQMMIIMLLLYSVDRRNTFLERENQFMQKMTPGICINVIRLLDSALQLREDKAGIR